MTKTIVAISTPLGSGALSVVKVSGPSAYDLLLSVTKKTTFKPRHATLTPILDESCEMVDEAIVIYFQAPHSYTAEDVVEIQCHGGVYIARRIVQLLLKAGARIARPGEFTYRAFLNQRIDLVQAEAIAKLIEVRSEGAHKALMQQLRGELSGYTNTIRRDLVEILAHIEVGIDYAEEDLPSDLVAQIYERMGAISKELEKLLENSKRRSQSVEGYRLAIIGRPNVGKSSLLNRLLMWERAIVSEVAGTTRDTLEENLTLGKHYVKLIDTAGIRESQDAVEKIGIQRSLEALKQSDIVLAVFDLSEAPTPQDLQIKELIKQYCNGKEVVILLNKSDLYQGMFNLDLEGFPSLRIAAKDGDLNELIGFLSAILDARSEGEEMILASQRQLLAIEGTLEHIKQASMRLSTGELEFLAYHLKDAIVTLASITRPFGQNELLDVMFGQFCLGK